MIEVWAPHPERVELTWTGTRGEQVATGTDAMVPTGDGWWRWEGEPTAYDVFDYVFVLDGAEPALPDPRSAWQPHGVHGPSRWFDAEAFAWSDGDWRGTRSGAGVLGGIIYELHVGTFTAAGTLDAAIDRLDHLMELGVDLVELMPLAAFPGEWGWGYDGVALYAVHDRYGGPAALQRFVDAAHARGLGVCLDVVHNHLGPSGNYLQRFGPYFTDTHHTPWGAAVNLDAPGSEQVRAFLIGQAQRWFRDFHVDALRLDAVHELKDDSGRHFLAELSDATAALAGELGRPLDLIAESDLNDVRMVAPTAFGGLGMTAQWDDDIHHALHVALTGEREGYYEDFGGGTATLPEAGPLTVLQTVLERGFLHDGRHSSFRGRTWGVPIDREAFDGRRLLAYLQTHDQVGNRAVGDRISATITPGLQACGAALMLLGPGTPMLFMGEEWGASTPFAFFTSFEDSWLADAVREGRRAEFAAHGWGPEAVPDPQDPATRDASVLDWGEAGTGDHARLLRWYADLIALRRTHLGDGETHFADVDVTVDEEHGWVVMRHRSVVVAANLAAGARAVPLPEWSRETQTLASVLRWGGPLSADGEAPDEAGHGISGGRITLGPHDCAVLRLP